LPLTVAVTMPPPDAAGKVLASLSARIRSLEKDLLTSQRLEQLQSQLVQLKQGPLSGPGENLSTAAAARAMKGAVS